MTNIKTYTDNRGCKYIVLSDEQASRAMTARRAIGLTQKMNDAFCHEATGEPMVALVTATGIEQAMQHRGVENTFESALNFKIVEENADMIMFRTVAYVLRQQEKGGSVEFYDD